MSVGDPVFQGETLTTGEHGALEVHFQDDTILSQGPQAILHLDHYVYDESTGMGELLFNMAQGTFRSVTGTIVDNNPEGFQLQSPLATIGIRGTETGHIVPFPWDGDPTEQHVVLVYDGKPVLVEPIGGGEFRLIGASGEKVDVSNFGAGEIQIMTWAEYTYFQQFSPDGMNRPPQYGSPEEVLGDNPDMGDPVNGDDGGEDGGSGDEGGDDGGEEGGGEENQGDENQGEENQAQGEGGEEGGEGGEEGQDGEEGQEGQQGQNQGQQNEVIVTITTTPKGPVIVNVPGAGSFQASMSQGAQEILEQILGGGDGDGDGGGDDTLPGGSGGDDFTQTGDVVSFGSTFDNTTTYNGSGTETVSFTPDTSTTYTFSCISNVSGVQLDVPQGSPGTVTVTPDDSFVGSGQTVEVDGSALTGGFSLAFDGSGETDGYFEVKGGMGGDVITGSDHNPNGDTLYGGAGDDTLNGMAGYDTLYGEAGSDTLDGGDHDDTLHGGAGNDVLIGGAGNDDLYGEGGMDSLSGGTGDDTFHYSSTSEVVSGEGIDGGSGHEVIGDTLSVEGNVDFTQLGPSAISDVENLLVTASNTATFDAGQLGTVSGMTVKGSGGGTVETLVLKAGVTNPDIDLSQNSLTFDASWGTEDVLRVQGTDDANAIVDGDGNSTILAGGGADDITGGLGDDVIDGGAGDDIFRFSSSRLLLTEADSLDGGAGNDTLYYYGDDMAGYEDNLDGVRNVENLHFKGYSTNVVLVNDMVAAGETLNVDASGMNANTSLTFDASAETNSYINYTGNNHRNDVTLGKLTNSQTVLGGSGDNDTLTARTLDERALDGVDKFERITFLNGSSDIRLSADTLSWASNRLTVDLAGNMDFDIKACTSDMVKVNSTTGSNTITIGNMTHSVDINGGGGDTLVFTDTNGAADDLDNVEGVDTIVAKGTVNVTAKNALRETGRSLTFDGSQATSLAFNYTDESDGTAGYTIIGSDGGDTITAGTGADTVNGGAGDDTFVFGSKLSSADTIDGGAGIDSLDFRATSSSTTDYLDNVTNVESFTFYDATTNLVVRDGLAVDDGQGTVITMDAHNLTHSFTLDASAETDWHYAVTGGSAADKFYMGNMTSATSFDGGGGNDELHFSDTGTSRDELDNVTHVESIILGDADTELDLTRALSQTNESVSINANALTGSNALDLNGSCGFDGDLSVTGSAQADTFTMGTAMKSGIAINGNGGADTLTFTDDGQDDTALNGVQNVATIVATGIVDIAVADSVRVNGTNVEFDASGATSLAFDSSNESNGAGGYTVKGTGAADTFTTGAGDDTLYGNGGNDIFQLSQAQTSSSDIIDGGAGMDTVYWSTNTGAWGDQLNGLRNVERVVLGDFYTRIDAVDSMVANGETLTIDATGLTGVNHLTFYATHHSTFQTLELDGSYEILGSAQNDTVFGGAGADTLYGNGGADTLKGFGGDDTIEGGAGGDVLNGGAGNDTLSYASDTAGVTVDLSGTQSASGIGSHADGDSISGFENATGGSGNDYLRGDGSANTLHGGAGDDDLVGNGGLDVLFGEAGNDRIFVSSTGWSSIDGGDDTDTLKLEGDLDLDLRTISDAALINIETIDLLTGNHTLTLDVNEVLNISSTTDTLRIEGDQGDTVNLDGGWTDGGSACGYHTWTLGDAIVEVDNDVNVTFGATDINGTTGNDTLSGTSGNDTINAFSGDDDIDGLAGNDTIYGGNGMDDISGGSGNDSLYGGNGDDTLAGCEGNDDLHGENGDDVFVFNGDAGTGSINSGEGDENGGDTIAVFGSTDFRNMTGISGVENLDFIGDTTAKFALDANETAYESGWKIFGEDGTAQHLMLDGSGETNPLTVDLSQNTFTSWENGMDSILVSGGSGVDFFTGNDNVSAIFQGNYGADTFTSGTQADMFRYTNPDQGGDTIANFTQGSDGFQIDKTGFGIGGTQALGTDWFFEGAAWNAGGNNGSHNAPTFIYDTYDGDHHTLYFDPDGSGAATGYEIADIGSSNMSANDITVDDFSS